MKPEAAFRQDLPEASPPFWKRRWFQSALLVSVAVSGAYGLMYRDVVSRAKEAYLQGEQQMAWHRDPAAKRKFFDEKFQSQKAVLDSDLSAKRISEIEYQSRLETLQFDHDFALSESSVKYAYQWYKDASEIFSPPESKWVKLARQKAPEALDLWKAELRSRQVPFDESIFE